MDMVLLQAACAAILALYLVLRLRRDAAPGRTVRRLGLLLMASWLGEDSLIRAYGFYAYSPGWGLFIDRVPLLIVCIWPVVVDSAWHLARCLGRPVPLGFALVLSDAALIEPIAVRAGLWRWSEPGLFGVPPIGLLGWALFAAACIALFERRRSWLQVLVLPPLFTHAALILIWWGLLRWVSLPLPSWAAAAAAWGVALPLAVLIRRRCLGRRVPIGGLLVRLPGALFFFVLLALSGDAALWAYALAFVPPYLVLMDWRGAAS
jgi:hypothetical protein